ncbi:MAG: cysteine peptidase family C39 domain-containing protein [Candidatus Nanoarchaeia archaeon]|nr:cysteine peptidase family C39 domain-containing protein [Candidatus Nanoarchaeia archaeon]
MLKIKPFKSSPAHCGPGTLKMFLGYYGIEKTEKQLAKELKWNKKEGVTARNMVKAAKKYGFEGFVKDNSSLSDIAHYAIGKKMPVIVEWFLEDDSHFSVVAGIDKKKIYLADPFIGKIRTLKRDYFASIWFGFEGECMKTKNDLFLRRMVVLEKK